MDISAVCEKKSQAEALYEMDGISRIFHPGNTLPYIFREDAAKECEAMLSMPRLLARSIDGLGFLRRRGYKGEIYADHTLYTFNKASRGFLRSLGVSFDTAPLELTFRELEARGMEGSELMIYGRIPMMISAGCVFRNTHDDRCEKDIERGHELTLTDRTDTGFPVICFCRSCYNVIYNSVPLSLHAHADKISRLSPSSVRLYFTTESPHETKETAGYFIRLIKDRVYDAAPPYSSYTGGHFIKKTE